MLLPSSAAEAVDLLRQGGWIVSGGTVVMPRVNTGAIPVDRLVSLRKAGLDEIHVDHTTATLGAATTLAKIGAYDGLRFLHPVIRSIASPPVRNLATVGGNLFVAQPHGDLAVALLALDARVEIVGRDGTREVSVGELSANPGEIVSTVHFELPRKGTWFYRKAMRRKHNSASIVTVAAVVAVEDGVVRSVRIALGGVAPRPIRAHAAEQALLGGVFDRSTVESAAEAAREGIEPFDDAYASAWYRARVLPVHVRRALLGE
ncbi:CO/xanthine dehydrogenase FAD-binding subunit [Kibdelosporangium banguiense]|uniref:CO/xanthine dehydrogenase FAD-binding subunit n=1 Tax=Kibdelosporangium banguiense TaxID=1365924 RepID=A0ABS4TTQ1_9PSEU|nr:FAD binding domain-containing protein [Kibdelosporangium banguiense]MBP2327783.1 CO/xanthine dehydrogenase FAD-binding subunit [Kibdelosporangium banguiense]